MLFTLNNSVLPIPRVQKSWTRPSKSQDWLKNRESSKLSVLSSYLPSTFWTFGFHIFKLFSTTKKHQKLFLKKSCNNMIPRVGAIRKTADISRLAIKLWVANTGTCQKEECFSLSFTYGMIKFLYTTLVIYSLRSMCGVLTGISGSFPWRLGAEYSSKRFVCFILLFAYQIWKTEARNGSTILFNFYRYLSF